MSLKNRVMENVGRMTVKVETFVGKMSVMLSVKWC